MDDVVQQRDAAVHEMAALVEEPGVARLRQKFSKPPERKSSWRDFLAVQEASTGTLARGARRLEVCFGSPNL